MNTNVLSQNVLQFKPNMPKFYYNPAEQFQQAIKFDCKGVRHWKNEGENIKTNLVAMNT